MNRTLTQVLNARPVNAAMTAAHRARNRVAARSPRRKLSAPPGRQESDILAQLEIDGLAVVPDFLPADACAALREEIDAARQRDASLVNTDPEDCDHRLFAYERVSEAAARFHDDPWLHDLAQLYSGAEIVNAFTMAGVLVHRPINRGSGLGWHRDSFDHQFKAIIYLSDVGEDNGPFQYLCGSSHLSHMLQTIWRDRLGYMQTRLSEEEVERIVARAPEKLRTVTGSAGSLVLADTSAIHRGMPIRAGSRYALTNYYYVSTELTDSVLAHLNRNVVTADGRPVMRPSAR